MWKLFNCSIDKKYRFTAVHIYSYNICLHLLNFQRIWNLKTSQWDQGRIHLMTFMKRYAKYTILTVEIAWKYSKDIERRNIEQYRST